MGKKSKKSKEELIAKRLAKAQAGAFVQRPFEGLPFEADLVCLRELVPAATATAKLTEEYGGDEIIFASLLPAAWQALHRADGVVMAGLQVPFSSPDPSRDIAAAILSVKDAEPGTYQQADSDPGEGPRLQDILDTSVPFSVSVLETFDYWLPEDTAQQDEDIAAALEQANENISPTEKLVSAEAAYWTEMGGRIYVRWARTDGEETVMNGLARLHARGDNTFGGIGKYLGCFRAHGIVIPVWELPDGTQPDEVEGPLGTFDAQLTEAMNESGNLDYEERRAKAGVVSRQLTIR
ncbi:DUF5926 family protein [Brevibacterium sp. R8603A2]|uniref:DUF5926 family protein n=1 Tax=Brevibacterium pityocampae TaxID=506594 RepID=A0ABP8J2V6_9MICO|nr:DUF5926 family protein [Brevibacterium sp. R8603A2]MCK1803965.1 DUF5926 family protein [Brevibacterium sp. R8603A2]